MNIAPLDIGHHPEVYDMLEQFTLENPHVQLPPELGNFRHVSLVLFHIQNSGVGYVSYNLKGLTGMILAQTINDVWIPEQKFLVELAWWVKPEYRGSSAGAKLLKAYSQKADQMLHQGDVVAASLSTLDTSPDLKLTKRGWKPTQQQYMRTQEA